MGKDGLKIKNGQIIPDKEKLAQMMALWGPAAKPGDLARISNIVIKDNYIHFEINGGPVKKQKWYQRIQIEGAGGGTPIAPSDQNANARGSFVDLYFDHHVPELTGPELKQLLRPVFDFDSKSPVEAYLETVSPKVKDAIKNHKILVGMFFVLAKRPAPPLRSAAWQRRFLDLDAAHCGIQRAPRFVFQPAGSGFRASRTRTPIAGEPSLWRLSSRHSSGRVGRHFRSC